MRGLKDKVAVVTGAGAGIGQAAAIRLAEEGVNVGIFDWNEDGANETAGMIKTAGGKAIAIKVDVREEAAIESAYRKVVDAFGKLDIVCSNAAVFSGARDRAVDELPKDVWDEFIGVNLTGMFLTCKHGIRTIKATAGKGAVVLTGSPTGMSGCTPANIGYGSSKGGVHALSRIMAVDHAKNGIRVNVVVPGFTLTKLVKELVADPKIYEWQVNQIPLHRGAEPHEVAGAIAFMASDDASYMTGSFMFVDGGLTAI